MIVDLFAGPGGLDVAAHWLGVPSIGIEFDESAVATREAAGFSTIFDDVSSWQPTDFTSAMNVLTGGPPCQTYTVAGNGHGRQALARVLQLVQNLGDGQIDCVADEIAAHSDPRTGLVLQPLIWALRAVEADRPYQAIMLEQVPEVRPVWEATARVLEARGYGVDVDVLCTEEYGVPQTRRRAVLIARYGITSDGVQLPAATHQKYVGKAAEVDASNEFGCSLPRWVSMAEALDISGPFVVVSNYGSGGDSKNRGKRRHDRPAFTVTGKASRNKIVMGGGDESRRFGSREAGRLQTFPDGYPWSGRDVSQQIGNAIPPRLGTHVLRSLLGIDIELNDAFFAERRMNWKGPDRATLNSVRDAVAREDVVVESRTTITAKPERVASSRGGEVLGVVRGSPTLDAVEPREGHRTRTSVAV